MASAVTLTGLIPDIYASLNVINRELIGFIPAVSKNSSGVGAAIDQAITIPIVEEVAAEDVTVGFNMPDTGATTVGNVTMAITKARSVPIPFSGEETMTLMSGNNYADVRQQRITQALRTLTNEIETDIAALHIAASRAYGTFNTVPFGTAADFSDFAGIQRILDENGVAASDRHLVLGASAMANLRGKQSVLFKANEAGTDDFLRRGIIGQIQGLDLHYSDKVKAAVTVGTGASATTNTAGYAVGATVITLASAGTGTIIAGDIITFAGDTNKYLVASGDTDVSNGGTITLAKPGLKVALAASAVAITVIAATTRNMAFSRSAIQLLTRTPTMPEGGDMADDIKTIPDPVSGLFFQFCKYSERRRIRYEVSIAWGVKIIKPESVAILIGA